MSEPPLLRVEDLTVGFATEGGTLRAVDGVSFEVPERGAVALVGESGCGKSVTAQAILKLLPEPPAHIERGDVVFEEKSLFALSDRELERVRGGKIGLVFQEPMTSLNPVYTVGWQVAEAVRLHLDVSRREANSRAVELLRRVGMPEPERSAGLYPHEISGGMRQRTLIAAAIACDPRLLIADEPTTALDASLERQIMALFAELRREQGTSLLLIAHDLALVESVADSIVVLYAGVVVEQGPSAAILRMPGHPYTQALLRCVPKAGSYRTRGKKRARLPVLGGAIPDLRSPPEGCRFQDRCPHTFDRCREESVPLYRVERPEGDVRVRCFLFDPADEGRRFSVLGDSLEEPAP